MVCPAHVPVWAKSARPLTTPIATGAALVLVTVTVCAWLAVPTGELPKERFAGDKESPGGVLCPLSAANAVTSPPASLATTDPESMPTAVGAKLRLMVHVAPAGKVAGHWLTWLKSVEIVTGFSVRGVVPVFSSVMVCAWLGVSFSWPPKMTKEGVIARPSLAPCPCIVTTCVPLVSVIVTVPGSEPVTVGAKTMLMLQLVPAGSEPRQLVVSV